MAREKCCECGTEYDGGAHVFLPSGRIWCQTCGRGTESEIDFQGRLRQWEENERAAKGVYRKPQRDDWKVKR